MSSSSNSSSKDEVEFPKDECIDVGEIVWTKFGRTWYPAKVCCLENKPLNVKDKLKRGKDHIIVKWYDDGDNYASLNVKDVDSLADNKIDHQRAASSKKMMELYSRAHGDKWYNHL